MFPAFKKSRAFILVLLLIIIVNVSFTTLLYFHEPSKVRLNKVYKEYYKGYKSVDDFNIHKVWKNDDIRYKLSKAFPYEKTTEKPPRNIWQMWKNNDIGSLDQGLQDLIKTWTTQQDETKGSFKYELIGDDQLSVIVNSTFVDVPEVQKAFHILPKIILKSDFMRYLLVFAFGGIYSDIDTSLNKDILDWFIYKDQIYDVDNKVGLTIGIESDRDEKSWARNGMARRLQFCQWTIQSKVGHPFYRQLIYRISDLALNHFNPETNILTKNGQEYDMNSGSPTKFAGIMEWTGPGMFTDVLFEYLNDVYKRSESLTPGLDFAKERMINPNWELDLQSKIKYPVLKGSWHNEYDPIERPIGWQNITKQVHPILFDEDVLLLPIIYFNGKKGDPDDYTQHHFKGSWKS
ncbi:unnamed protein product [Wickerhamomyces anomalus]